MLGFTLTLVTRGFAEPATKAPVAPTQPEPKPDLGEPEAVAKERARLLFEFFTAARNQANPGEQAAEQGRD